MAFAAALVLALLALVIAPGYSFYFDVTPKVAVLLVGTAVLLTLAARRKESPRGPRLFAVLLLFNGASLGFSTACSANRALSIYGGSERCFGALAQAAAMLFAWLVAWQSAGRPDRGRIVLRGVSISGVVVGVCGVVRPPGTLGDTGHLASWLIMSAFLSMALADMEPHRVARGLARAAVVLTLAALIFMGVRAAPWAGPHRLLWRDSLSMAARRPAAGYGPEIFLAEFPHFESKPLAQVNPDAVYSSPHNAFLDTLVSQGLAGLLLLCGLCVAGIAAAWKRRAVWLAAALVAGIVALQFDSFIVPTAALFFTTIGLAVALAEEPGATRPSPAFSAVSPLLVVPLIYFALRFVLADHALWTTRRLLEARDLSAATAEYDAYNFWRLPGASADVWYSRSWLEVARSASDPSVRSQALAIAEQAGQRATVNAEEPFRAWYNLAQIAASQDNSENVSRNLRWAISAFPNWYLPHWMLSQRLLGESRVEESQKEAALAAELDAGHHPEFAPLFVIR